MHDVRDVARLSHPSVHEIEDDAKVMDPVGIEYDRIDGDEDPSSSVALPMSCRSGNNCL